MNDQIDQPQKSLFEREGIQEVGEELLEAISGGVLDTPGRGARFERTNSAPGRLQGNPEGSLPNSPAPSSPTVDTPANHPLQDVRVHPNPPQVTFAPDYSHITVDGITRRFQ
jgi:hypothetical protein